MKQPTITVRDILTQWLNDNGYDGLYNDTFTCACSLQRFMHCDDDEDCDSCVPGIKISTPGASHYRIGPGKPNENNQSSLPCCQAEIEKLKAEKKQLKADVANFSMMIAEVARLKRELSSREQVWRGIITSKNVEIERLKSFLYEEVCPIHDLGQEFVHCTCEKED